MKYGPVLTYNDARKVELHKRYVVSNDLFTITEHPERCDLREVTNISRDMETNETALFMSMNSSGVKFFQFLREVVEDEPSLKPCPFCGGKPKVMVREYKYLGQNEFGDKLKKLGFYVRCNRCYARGGTFVVMTLDKENPDGISGAYSKWNSRMEATNE